MIRSTKRTIHSSSRSIPRRAKVICFRIRPESVSQLTSKLRAVFSHFWFGLLFSQFSVQCQPKGWLISYSTAMEGAGSFSKVHSFFSEEVGLLKDTGSPLCYTRYIVYLLLDIAAFDLMNNTPKSQGIVVTVRQIRFLIYMRACILSECSTIFRVSSGSFPQAGVSPNYLLSQRALFR